MGNLTGSTFWMFFIVIIIYIVGALIYTLIQKIKERKWK